MSDKLGREDMDEVRDLLCKVVGIVLNSGVIDRETVCIVCGRSAAAMVS